METNRGVSGESRMGEIYFRLADRIPACWEMAGSVPEVLDSGNTEFLERDIDSKRLCDQDHPLADTITHSESGHGYSVLT